MKINWRTWKIGQIDMFARQHSRALEILGGKESDEVLGGTLVLKMGKYGKQNVRESLVCEARGFCPHDFLDHVFFWGHCARCP